MVDFYKYKQLLFQNTGMATTLPMYHVVTNIIYLGKDVVISNLALR